jgi:hypothetical protein
LRAFESIVAFLSDREIDELQAAIDARRDAHARSRCDDDAAATPRKEPHASELGYLRTT